MTVNFCLFTIRITCPTWTKIKRNDCIKTWKILPVFCPSFSHLQTCLLSLSLSLSLSHTHKKNQLWWWLHLLLPLNKTCKHVTWYIWQHSTLVTFNETWIYYTEGQSVACLWLQVDFRARPRLQQRGNSHFVQKDCCLTFQLKGTCIFTYLQPLIVVTQHAILQ